jgi:hypothetical protein
MSVTRQQAIQLVYALMYGPSHDAHRRLDKPVPPRLVASLRRLLDDDVARARANWDHNAVHSMAFYDELPIGTGHQVEYAPYRVFNLAVAHELARFGCKQREIVDFIADSHSELRTAFAQTNENLQTSGRTRFMQSSSAAPEMTPRQRREQLNIYLVLRRVEATESAVAYFGEAVRAGDRLTSKEILYGPAELQNFLSRELNNGLFGGFVMELSELAVRITELIARAPVRKRGRKSSEPPSNWGEAVAQLRGQESGHDK